jgi:hypothetical protein
MWGIAMINFTRAFDSAWERMHVILFRPFAFGKWCAIGLSAFLAGLLQGGNGFNGSFNLPSNNTVFPKAPQSSKLEIQQFDTSLGHFFSSMQLGLLIFFGVLIFIFIFGFIFLLYWLGARGQFMFLDNIVRNRGAISWPWQYYKRQANSLFLFYLLIFALSIVVILILGGIGVVTAIPLFVNHRTPDGWEIGIFGVIALVYLLLCLVFGVVFFLFREFGVPLMFRNGLKAREAFVATLGLLQQHPGSMAIFILLRIAIFIGVAILSVIICCFTFCIGMLPYIGTVILLPVLIYVKCFTLDCLAQVGPEYDVWTVDVPPAGPAGIPPFNPQPPPG